MSKEFNNFSELTKRLLSVRKTEIDKRHKEQQQQDLCQSVVCCDALAKKIVSDHAETVKIRNEMLLGSAIVVAEHLLVKVAHPPIRRRMTLAKPFSPLCCVPLAGWSRPFRPAV